MKHQFTSTFTHGEQIKFIPPARLLNELSLAKEPAYGEIVAIRFTKAKVFYDIIDDYHGIIFDNVDSAFVFELNEEISSEIL